MSMRPSGISVYIRQDLDEGAARTGNTLIIDPIITKDGHRLTTSDLANIEFAKIDQGTSNEEIISFTGITDNTSTYTLTGCVWGYNFYNTTGSVSANQKKHIAGAKLIITNDFHFINEEFIDKNSTQTIVGPKTFTITPKSNGGNPTVNTDLVIKSYVDALVLGTLTTINVIVPGKAGETVADGQLVYFDETDNEWKLTDADTPATVQNVLLGIAQGAGTNGNAITNGVLLQGVDDAQSGLTEGDVQYASNTAGAISSTPGTTEVTVGIAKSATELYFNPRFNQQLTEDQQDALAGTSGTPSSTNKYVTNDDTAENTASKIVRRKSDGTIAGGSYQTATFVAGENLTALDPVCLSVGSSTAITSIDTDVSQGYTIDNGGNWQGQTFLTAPDAVSIKDITLYGARTSASDTTATVSIRATSAGLPTGSDIEGKTATATFTSSAANKVFTFSSPVTVSPSTTYAIIIRYSSGGISAFVYGKTTSVYLDGNRVSSTDSGANWTASAASDLETFITSYITTSGSVYKAIGKQAYDPAGVNNTSYYVAEKLSFYGYVVDTVTKGNNATIAINGVLGGFTSLTKGSQYYVNDSSAIATTQGTYVVSAGKAISTTQIFIDGQKNWGSNMTSFNTSTTYTSPVQAEITLSAYHSASGSAVFGYRNGAVVIHDDNPTSGSSNKCGIIYTIVKGETWQVTTTGDNSTLYYRPFN